MQSDRRVGGEERGGVIRRDRSRINSNVRLNACVPLAQRKKRGLTAVRFGGVDDFLKIARPTVRPLPGWIRVRVHSHRALGRNRAGKRRIGRVPAFVRTRALLSTLGKLLLETFKGVRRKGRIAVRTLESRYSPLFRACRASATSF